MPKIEIEPILGNHVRVVHSSNPTQIGLEGLVVSETRNTLTVHGSKSNGAILEKASIVLQIFRDDGSKTIQMGKALVGLPYDRMKRLSRR